MLLNMWILSSGGVASGRVCALQIGIKEGSHVYQGQERRNGLAVFVRKSTSVYLLSFTQIPPGFNGTTPLLAL